MHITVRITGRFLLCLMLAGLTSCIATDHHNTSSRAAELHEKYLGGDLYRAGRHIHHHPEWEKPAPRSGQNEKD